MSKKENFNQAVFDMFGVGKPREDTMQEEQYAPAPEPIAEPVVEQPRWTQPVEVAPQPRPVEIVRPVVPVSAPIASPVSTPVSAPVIGPTVAPFSVVAATYIAPGTIVEGNLRCKGDVEVAGELRGDIISEGDVTVRTNIKGNISAVNLRVIDCRVKGNSKISGRMNIDVTSVVEGNVEAVELVCSGIIRGDSRVANNITLDASAKVFGNIETDTMSMERGASISGGLVMGKHWDDDDEPKKEEKKPRKTAKPAGTE